MPTATSLHPEPVMTVPRTRPSGQSDSAREVHYGSPHNADRICASDADSARLLSSGQAGEAPRKVVEAQTADAEAESDFGREAALNRLVGQWADVAVSHAMVHRIDDPVGHVATVAGIEGAWGFGDSEEAAFDELRSVLIGWASLKLEHGDDDIPIMEGVHLVVNR